MATRTAPAFTAAAQLRKITLHLIDASGDLWSEEINVGVAEAAVDIEAWAAAYAATSQASLWKITDELVRQGAPLVANADAGMRSGGESGINMLFKNYTTGATESQRLVAPVPDVMLGNSDTVDTTFLAYTTLADATEAILLTTAVLTSSQYTVHRERRNNTRTRG